MNIACTIALTIVLSPLAFAQELSIMRSSDTLTLRSLVFPTPENLLWQTPPPFPMNPSDTASLANLSAGFLRSELLYQPSLFGERLDLSTSLKLRWKTEDRFQLLRSALGYVMVGGEAYMLYRALKKYQFIR